MNDYLLPVNEEFFETIAKAIAKSRLLRDAIITVEDSIGPDTDIEDTLDELFDPIFDRLWQGQSAHDQHQRESYIEDARVAIADINLKLLTLDR